MGRSRLREFGFDARAPNGGRYRDLVTGQFVSQQVIDELIQESLDNTSRKLQALAAGAADPNNGLTAADFRRAAALVIRDAHVSMALLGSGGRNNITAAQLGRVGAKLKQEYRFLNQFAREIEQGTVSVPQAVARAKQYANAPYNSYHAARNETAAKRGGFTQERRVLGDAEHCPDCVRYAARGWQPIGTLPKPTERSVCRSNCKCTMEYR